MQENFEFIANFLQIKYEFDKKLSDKRNF